MSFACTLSHAAPSLARDVIAGTDCLIAGRVQSAYAMLLAPGGSLATALTLALTVYVAIVGYRLLLGQTGLTLGELVPHFIKIGLIVAVVTSWPAYQRLVFDVLFHAPEQVGGAVLRQVSDSPATGQGDVLAALQSLFDRLTGFAGDAWGQGATAAAPATPAAVGTPPPAAPSAGLAALQLGPPQFVAAALWVAAFLMMAASVGTLLVARIVLALLLVFGPVFIALGLFAATRGLFEGWLRVAVKFAAVPLFTVPLTAAMLAVLLPFADQLRDGPIDNFRDTPALGILLVVLVFAAVLVQVARITGGIAKGIRVPQWRADGRTDRRASTAGSAARLTLLSGAPVAGAAALLPAAAAGRRITVAPTALEPVRALPGLAAPTIDPGARLGQTTRRAAVGAPRRLLT